MKRIWIACAVAGILSIGAFWLAGRRVSIVFIGVITCTKEDNLQLSAEFFTEHFKNRKQPLSLFDDRISTSFHYRDLGFIAQYSLKHQQLKLGTGLQNPQWLSTWDNVSFEALKAAAREKGDFKALGKHGAVQTLNQPWPKPKYSMCP